MPSLIEVVLRAPSAASCIPSGREAMYLLPLRLTVTFTCSFFSLKINQKFPFSFPPLSIILNLLGLKTFRILRIAAFLAFRQFFLALLFLSSLENICSIFSLTFPILLTCAPSLFIATIFRIPSLYKPALFKVVISLPPPKANILIDVNNITTLSVLRIVTFILFSSSLLYAF